MKPIYIECQYTILKDRPISESDSDVTFTKKIGRGEINLTVSYHSNSILALVTGAELEDSSLDELSNLGRFDGDKLSQKCDADITSIFSEVRVFVRQVLTMLKYHLNHFDIKEQLFSIKSELWGENETSLRALPSRFSVSSVHASICPLTADSSNLIRASLDNEVESLLAMRHLHRAKSESSPHHKWIDATIAAELAVKEVLSKARPELELLLLDMPSPPLSKLYGKILEAYLGEASPYRKKIIHGVEIRNILVHRHDGASIDSQKANDYVKDIECAIFHLLTLLYPEDLLIQQTYARVKL
ncbi:hypothetical protein ACOMICROBIO_LMKGKHOH_02161 [Vibrio sp. B1FIG11]|uniref:hypothetical protein n=1 Tax=Vibrio sp. B1FIG11 TaxID=2751177 RepID=UPI001AF10D68|nr:hypothetical protein [Vibrio sp. B1FIG11]CAD7806635.1 hypothetical protein ACOMICROBIO_LMKGKHOH_02161 [Vibrio sp. B1FIG11]CAE6902356.1 hypothetical protein ACOMICROBIO_LMKGKHOH_02161 [Vibrio sp. B1FIG11]